MSGMRDVARVAGVALSTVSAVLSDSGKTVSEEIRQRVIAAADEVHYVPKKSKMPDTRNIVVMLNANPVATAATGLDVLKSALEDKHTMICCYSLGRSYETEKRYLRSLVKNQTRALIDFTMCPVNQLEEYCLWLRSEFVDSGIPVLIAGKKISVPGIISVSIDNEKIGYDATVHLLDRGHRRIACLLGRNGSSASAKRYQGYCRALRERGLPVDPNLIVSGDYTFESGEACLRSMLQGSLDFTALFSANDDMAIGAINAIKKAGKRIPEDIAVIGVNGSYASQIVTPTLSTIEIPIDEQWLAFSACIRDALVGKSVPSSLDIPYRLIARESTEKR